jgi:PKD repeat protein
MHNRFFARTAVASLVALAASTSACSDRSPVGPDPLPDVTPGRVFATPAATLTDVSVTFVSQGASAKGRPLTFTWDFGDGETATGATTSHAYSSVGDFVVKLTVNDDAGNSATASSTVTVKDLSAEWVGDASGSNPLYGGHTVVTILQDGPNLTGTYRDDSTNPGTIAGTIDEAGGVVFTVTIPEMVPFTFTGVATVGTLVGVANGSGFDNQPWTLGRWPS